MKYTVFEIFMLVLITSLLGLSYYCFAKFMEWL